VPGLRFHSVYRAGNLPLLCVAALLLLKGTLNGEIHRSHAQEQARAKPQLPPELETKLQALEAASGDAKTAAEKLNEIGALLYRTSNCAAAQDSYGQALTLAHSIRNSQAEAAALSGSGSCRLAQGGNRKALALYRQALDVATSAADERGQATALDGIGWASSNLGQNQIAMASYQRALVLARRAQDAGLEATTLLRAGTVNAILGKRQTALEDYNQSLSLFRAQADRFGEAATLNNLGVLRDSVGEKPRAQDFYNQALAIRREIGDRDGIAWTSANLGNIAKTLRTKQEALDAYNQALAIFLEVGDRSGEAAMRIDLGSVYRELGEQQKALESYQLALPLYRQTGDRGGEAAALTDIGNVYYALGDKHQAIDSYKLAAPIRREVGNPAGEATTLNNIGAVYVELGRNTSALTYLDRALTIRRMIDDRAGEAATLINLGNVNYILGRRQQALANYVQASRIDRDLGDRDGEAGTLNNIGFVYASLGQRQKALACFHQALPLATAVRDPIEEARIYANLMLNRRPVQPTLAIYYGKRAINLLQQVRGNIQGLDKALQKSFLDSKYDDYHQLAELLIAQSRLPEAEQVLDLLKQQEYSDYVRGETGGAPAPLALTPAEEQAEEQYEQSTAQLVSLGEQFAQLKKTASRTPEQEKLYAQIGDQLDSASKGLNDYYARLYVLLGNDSGANRQVADMKGDVSALKQAIAKIPHTVALYTLVGSDRISVIVITPAAAVARTHTIAAADLNKKVVAFQRALRDPTSDPRPIAHEMYDLLLGPVKADLDQAQAQTLIWSLDGVLRYVPMAALYDGKQYLVENYNSVTITPASMSHLADKPDVSNLSATAMGISDQYEARLPALPAVRSELYDVVSDAQVKGANGVLPGTILLDRQFTEKAMEAQLSSPHAVLHIASHFVFRAGDASQSYLLLSGKDEGGAGFHLTVADFRDNQRLTLDDIDLLTLSACDTGMSGVASNGREVDGLGTTAQLKGAKAVLSSLWEVNDESTGMLMAAFYKRWSEGSGKIAKVQALRDAQLSLLTGAIKPKEGNGDYSHPYYWAPFVLMGNWR
jgi:CHAT domain-containing protein